MQDSIKIEEIEFTYNGDPIKPAQTYITQFGEVYIAFKTINGAYLNISANEVKKHIDNPNKHGISLTHLALNV